LPTVDTVLDTQVQQNVLVEVNTNLGSQKAADVPATQGKTPLGTLLSHLGKPKRTWENPGETSPIGTLMHRLGRTGDSSVLADKKAATRTPITTK
tara:strand:- start:450 stop:734 length:285 start_codon:yes stop_codon:yes gene_type:complete